MNKNDNNVLESMPEEEVLLDEKMEVQIDIKMLTPELLDLFELRCNEKLGLCIQKGFKIAEESLIHILGDIQLERKRRDTL